jgi:hypothetical protein
MVLEPKLKTLETVPQYFSKGRNGRTVSADTGRKIMIPVAGIAPEDGRSYYVKVIRDTAPGERRGALLVEVLESKEERAAKEEVAAKKAKLVQEIVGMGLAIPPAEEFILAGWPLAYPANGLNVNRDLIRAHNSALVPEIPATVREATAAFVVAYAAYKARVAALPNAPEGWSPSRDGTTLEWTSQIELSDRGFTGQQKAMRITATITADGGKDIAVVVGELKQTQRRVLSPDEMGHRTVTDTTFIPYRDHIPTTEETAAANKAVPRPDEAREYFAEAQKVREQDAAAKAAYNIHWDIVEAWVKGLTPAQQFLLGAWGVFDVVRHLGHKDPR